MIIGDILSCGFFNYRILLFLLQYTLVSYYWKYLWRLTFLPEIYVYQLRENFFISCATKSL